MSKPSARKRAGRASGANSIVLLSIVPDDRFVQRGARVMGSSNAQCIPISETVAKHMDQLMAYAKVCTTFIHQWSENDYEIMAHLTIDEVEKDMLRATHLAPGTLQEMQDSGKPYAHMRVIDDVIYGTTSIHMGRYVEGKLGDYDKFHKDLFKSLTCLMDSECLKIVMDTCNALEVPDERAVSCWDNPKWRTFIIEDDISYSYLCIDSPEALVHKEPMKFAEMIALSKSCYPHVLILYSKRCLDAYYKNHEMSDVIHFTRPNFIMPKLGW